MVRSSRITGLRRPPQEGVPVDDETIAEIETALHALARRLKQARLHEFVLKQAGVDIDQARSEEHTSELQSRFDVVCRLLLEKKKAIVRAIGQVERQADEL